MDYLLSRSLQERVSHSMPGLIALVSLCVCIHGNGLFDFLFTVAGSEDLARLSNHYASQWGTWFMCLQRKN